MSNASGNESDGRGSASADKGVAEKVVKKGVKATGEKSKTRGEGDAMEENDGLKNKATGMWDGLNEGVNN
jgi:hypothetical protein